MARDKEKTSYANKVKCLMMQCMRPILKKLVRRTIRKQSPHGRRSWGIDAFLAHNKGRIENKLSEIDHNNMYRNILYPPDEETPRTDIHEWDVTLYLFILIDICRISRPQSYYFKQLLGIRNDLCKSSNSAITRDICKDYRKRIKRLRSKFYRHLRDDDLKEKIEKRANEIESGEMSSNEEEEVLKRWTDLEVSKVMIAAEKKSGLDKYVILRKLLSNCCAEVMRALVITTAKRNGHSYDRNGHWSLDIFLRKNKHRIDRRIHTVDKLERPVDILFPRRGKTKLEEWDLTLLCFVLLNVCFLDAHMADYIADIRRARNEIAHSSTVLNLTDSEYMAYVERLKGSISACLNFINDRGLSDFINGKISETEFGEVDKNETTRQLQRDREDQEKREQAREVQETIQKELSEIVRKFKDIGMPDLIDQLVQMYRKNYTHIPVSPFRSQGKCINKADVYVSPQMVIDVTDKSETESRRRTSNHTWESWYYKPVHDDRANRKTIVLVGKTGSGKSSLVNSLLGKTREPAIHDDDINELKKLDFLFFVPLQRMPGLNSNIIDMTKIFCKNFISESLIMEIFEKESERCLVLVDGLDEWTSRNKLVYDTSYCVSKCDTAKHAVIITLSRPSALKSLNFSQYDQKLILQGISIQTKNIFIEKYMSKLNLRDCGLEDFIMNVRKIKHIEKTPLLLLQLMCMNANGNTDGNSVGEIYRNLADALSKSENPKEK